MKYFLLLIILFTSTNLWAEFKENKISSLDDSEITFYIDRPENVSKFPYVIFMQGSECRSVLGRSFMPKNPANIFGAGIILVEKYGIVNLFTIWDTLLLKLKENI